MPNPFGISAGETPSSQVAEYFVRFHAVPKPHPDMKDYTGVWHPDVGLISISATSHLFRDDPSAHSSRALYDRLKKQLVSVYGPGRSVEHIDDDATWGDEDEFVPSLHSEERTHVTKWHIDEGSKLNANINEIYLSINADDHDSSSVMLHYKFTYEGNIGPGEEVGLASL